MAATGIVPARRWGFIPFTATRRFEEEQARNNPFLMQALEAEKHEGQRIGMIARTIALGLIALLLPYLNQTIGVLYYEAVLVAFVAIGYAQWRVARVGASRIELALIFLDLALLTFVCVVPSPFLPEPVPTAALYRFDNFIYFFVLLAVGTLAYSWRTVWTIGTWVALLWALALIGVVLFGRQMPELSAAAAAAFAGHEIILAQLDPNSADVPLRVQEIVVFFIVSGILALKGWRTNQLIMRQAAVAAERANLSRYFPPNLVNVLASTSHDVGAVRSQNVAVLFADIVGFTRIAEQHSPEKVMELLRHYHGVIERAIFENGGTLDKYLGDGVMATFGTPETGASDAANGFRAACRIIADMEECNRDCAARGDPEFRVSVGLHYGPVIVGDIGPSRRLEFAVLGDTVNVAARLEAATREQRCRMIVSGDVAARMNAEKAGAGKLPAEFQIRRNILLRGRSSPVDIWIGWPEGSAATKSAARRGSVRQARRRARP